MAAQVDAAQLEEEAIILSIYYGTSNLALSFREVTYNQDRSLKSTNAPRPLKIGGQFDVAPQEVAWNAQGDFVWGHEIQKEIDEGHLLADDVITLFKLWLYRELRTNEQRQQIELQLKKNNKSMRDLLEAHFKGIMIRAKSSLVEASIAIGTPSPSEVFLSVPQMWKATANKIMAEAAQQAGFAQVELFYEPQCAAAFLIDELLQRQSVPPHLQGVGNIVISDTGGGTGDYVKYNRFIQGSTGARISLSLLGQPRGGLCGSQMSNIKFRKWFQEQVCSATGDKFEAICLRLGRTRLDVLRRANAQFEEHKIAHSILQAFVEPKHITIYPKPGSAGPPWDIKLTSHQISSFVDPVIEENLDNMEALVDVNTTTIAVVGGMASSNLFLNRIRAKFPQIAVIGNANSITLASNNVSQGAQLRYDDIDTTSLRATGSFGLSQEEQFDPVIHPDANKYPVPAEMSQESVPKTRNNPARTPAVKLGWGYEDVQSSVPVSYVYHRFAPLLKKDDVMQPGQQHTCSKWQLDYVTPDQKTLSRVVYWTDDEELSHRGSPMLKPNRLGNAVWNDKFETWGTVTMECLNWEDQGFELRELKKSRGPKNVPTEDEDPEYETIEVYEVYSKFTIVCRGANVEFQWHVAKPRKHPFDLQGRPLGNASVEELYNGGKVLKLIQAGFNPNPVG